MSERWTQIPGWEGFYEVSDQGRVRSMDRTITRSDGETRKFRGKVLSPGNNRHGYPMVGLSRPGIKVTKKIHRLVLETFVGPCPEGMEACHNNGIRDDARLENLRWDTHQNNQLDSLRHGTNPQANKTRCPQGHPYDDSNTKVIPSRPTARYCRACHRQRSENRWHTIKKETSNV